MNTIQTAKERSTLTMSNLSAAQPKDQPFFNETVLPGLGKGKRRERLPRARSITLCALVFTAGLVCAFAEPPPNDNFANAQALVNGSTVAGTLQDATREPGDPFSGTGYIPPTVWYRWTATASGVGQVSVVFHSAQRSNLQTLIGSGQLTGKYITDDGDDSEFYVVQGQTYNICFDGDDAGATFTIGLAADASLPADTQFVPPLSNDNFDDALQLGDLKDDFVLYSLGATFEPFEEEMLDSVNADFSSGDDGGVWVAWTAPVTGSAVLTAKNLANAKIILLVGTGSSIETLDVLAGSDTGGVTFDCEKGVTYRLYFLNQSSDGLFASISATASNTHPAFFSGEASLGNGVYYLAFQNGNKFGYYNYSFFPYLYHYDLGFEYFIDANDSAHGAYLYDFASGHFFYTSPSFSFPYLYDFTLKAYIYYYPNAGVPGRYTAEPRYFYNFAKQQIFSM